MKLENFIIGRFFKVMAGALPNHLRRRRKFGVT
jgi:hypothetical protein